MSAAAHALKGLRFIPTKFTRGTDSWPAIESRFRSLTASTDGLLQCSSFGQCIGMNGSNEFAIELFRALARKRNITGDSINMQQLKEFWDQISDESFDSRLQTFFDMVDRDADGRITENEVAEIISLSASTNKLPNIREKAMEYAELIMEELDPEKAGYITIDNLEILLLQARNQSVRESDSPILSQMLSHRLMLTQENNPLRRWRQKIKYFIMYNWQRVWVMMLWLVVTLGLFAYKFVQYRHHNAYKVMGYCICVGKAGSEILKFNMALILLPVCRNTITWLRNKTKLEAAVPVDDNLNFHKVIAVAIAIGVGLHASPYLTCNFPRILHATDDEYGAIEPYFGENRPPNYWWFVKGVEGLTGIVMVVLMAIAFTLATPRFRRNRLYLPKPFRRFTGFNAFWYSHHLFVVVYTLLILHGQCLYLTKIWYEKTTWMYLAVPVSLYACERLIRAFRPRVQKVKILKVIVHAGNVLAVTMSKPQSFSYKSGQYIFVKCAAVSSFEWHPFSITSSPGDDNLSVHIRTLGDWTQQLKTIFSGVCQPHPDGLCGPPTANSTKGDNPSFPKILIDGPYGAPSQDYEKYDVVLLVGLGIGATPMISILKDIFRNIFDNTLDKDREEQDLTIEDALESGRGNSSSRHINKSKSNRGFKTRKAYYYWVTREQGSFQWFRGIMNEIADMYEGGDMIELHAYLTSVYEDEDTRSAFITMLQTLHHNKHGVDVVSGTRVKSHFGAPNWRHIFSRIAVHHPDSRVGIFYCGAPVVGGYISQLALDFSSKTSTKFEFHTERF